MSIIKKHFGKTKDGIDVNIFTITNKIGMKAEICTYGGAVVSLTVPDKNQNFDDIVLGYDNIHSYENGDKYFGAIIGRCSNRIEHGKFKINNTEYSVAINNGPNHHHGGIKGFDKVIWNAEILNNENNQLKLSYFSKDGEEGYPGNLNVNVIYSLTDDNSLEIHYHAISDADTFTVNDKFSVPTGEIRNVSGSPMDFTSLKTIGENINSDKNNTTYVRRSAVCLEAQFVPNAINNDNFTSPLLKANEEYNHTTIYKFSTL